MLSQRGRGEGRRKKTRALLMKHMQRNMDERWNDQEKMLVIVIAFDRQ